MLRAFLKGSPYLFVLLLGIQSLLATNPPTEFHFEHFGNEEGLSYNEVNCLYQDDRGLLWVGTWDGLCSFDGYEFSCLNRRVGGTQSIPDNEVNAILANQQGQLWVGFEAEISKLNLNNKLQPVLSQRGPSIQQLVRGFGENILATGGLPYGESRSLWQLKPENEAFELVEIPEEAMRRVNCLEVGLKRKAKLWIGGEGGVAIYALSQQKFTHDYPGIRSELSGKTIWSICQDREDGTYFGAEDHIYHQTRDEDHLELLPRLQGPAGEPVSIICMLADHKGNLWVGTHQGLFLWSVKEGKWTQLVHRESDPYSLSNNQVTCLLEDRSGVLWVGTQNGGLNKLNVTPKPFFNFPSSFFEVNDFVKVYAFEKQTDSTIWIGTTHGLFLFDHRGNRLMDRYEIPERFEEEAELRDWMKRSGEARTIMTIHQQANGRLLLGTRWLHLFEFDPVTEKFSLFGGAGSDCQFFSRNPVRKIHQNEKGELWLMAQGVHILNLESNNCKSFINGQNNEQLYLKSYYTWNLYQESECIYWIASNFGWTRWDVCAKTTRLSLQPGSILADNLSGDDFAVFCIEPGNKGLWMGTYGSGIVHLDTATFKMRGYSVEDGLSNNHVYGIIKDSRGELWMSTNRGISRFSPELETFTNYGYSDDLLIREFESNSYFRLESGEVFFGGKNGFVSFHPDSFQVSEYQTTPAITSFKVFGKELEVDSLIADKRYLRLASTQNFFEIGFSSLDFANQENTRYQFKLEPFDEDWNYLQGDHRTRYTNLAPGEYTFMLKAANRDGVFNSPIHKLRIDIVPQVYQRTWFIALMIVLGLGLLGGLVLQRLRLVRERDHRRVNQATYELEQEILRARINDHFTFNSLNSIQSFIAKHDKTKAMKYIAKFGRLLRMSLNSSEGHFHTLQEEVEALSLYLELEELRCGKAFSSQIEISPDLNAYVMEVPAMLVQPFVENAIWHGLAPLEEGGQLILQFSRKEDMLLISIIDNGIGREQARVNREKSTYTHVSRGLKLVQGRLDLLNQTVGEGHRFEIIDLYDNPIVDQNSKRHSLGTKVEAWIPLKDEESL